MNKGIFMAALVALAISGPMPAAQQNINLGTNPNDGTGDSLRAAMTKTQANFTDLYDNKVPGARTVNGRPLTEDIVLTAEDLGISGLPVFLAQPTEQGIRDAMALAVIAGGGIVQIPSADITLTAPLVLTSGVYLRGMQGKLTYGGIPDLYNTRPLGGDGNGTVLRGDGTFNLIEAQTTATTTPYASTTAFSNAGLTNSGVMDVMLVNGLDGIHIGATCTPGLFYGVIQNVYVFDCRGWGVWMENFQHCDFLSVRVYDNDVGGFAEVMSSGLPLSPGNTYRRGVYSASRGSDGSSVLRKSRGIVYWAKYTTLFGVGVGTYTQSTKFGSVPLGGGNFPYGTGIAGTTTNGSATIAVPSGTEFALDMPVAFAATAAGFTTKKIYFVRSISGNNLTLSASVRGAPVLATGSTTVTIGGSGFAPLEIVGYTSSDTVAAQTPSSNTVTFAGTGNNPDFVTGQSVSLSTTGTFPGLTAGTYYLIKTGANTYKFASSFANACAGTAVSISSAWTGTATVSGVSQVGGFQFAGLDLEAGGAVGVVAEHALGNLEGYNSPGGGTDQFTTFVQTLVSRSSTITHKFTGQHSTDSDTAGIEAGYGYGLANSVNIAPLGLLTDGVQNFGYNLNSTDTIDPTDPWKLVSFRHFFGTYGSWTRPSIPMGIVSRGFDSSSLTMGMSNVGGTSTNRTPDSTWALTPLTSTTPAAPGSDTLGMEYTVNNASNGVMNFTAGNFDYVSGRTTTSASAHSSISFKSSTTSSGDLIWFISGRSPSSYTLDVTYASSVTLSWLKCQKVSIASISGNMALENITGTPPFFPYFLQIELTLDAFASGTRNITCGTTWVTPDTAWKTPTVVTDANKRCLLLVMYTAGGTVYLINNPVWF